MLIYFCCSIDDILHQASDYLSYETVSYTDYDIYHVLFQSKCDHKLIRNEKDDNIKLQLVKSTVTDSDFQRIWHRLT